MRVLIVGGGQVAALIARRLIREGNEVTVVERDAERCSQLEAELDGKIVQGSAVSVKTLRKAGIADAEMLIAVTSSDEVNVLACLIAQVEAKKQVKVARLRTHEADSWREITAGAGLKIDLIIHPETDLAHRILRVITMPGVSDIQ
jgi:trk system potassium uptake protein TrkA